MVDLSAGGPWADMSLDLIELAKQNPAAVEKYTIRQIVGICGDGDLRDNSGCSQHLREFLNSSIDRSPRRLCPFLLG